MNKMKDTPTIPKWQMDNVMIEKSKRIIDLALTIAFSAHSQTSKDCTVIKTWENGNLHIVYRWEPGAGSCPEIHKIRVALTARSKKETPVVDATIADGTIAIMTTNFIAISDPAVLTTLESMVEKINTKSDGASEILAHLARADTSTKPE